jgi:hypothetical protein
MRKLPPFPVILPLLGLCLVPSLLHAMPGPHGQAAARTQPLLGIWQLKARTDANVTPSRGTKAMVVPPMQGFHRTYAIEPQTELGVTITQGGSTSESVTLSNALELEPQPRSPRFWLRFRLRTTRQHPIPLTLESAGKAFWSARVHATSTWHEVCLPVSLAQCKTDQVILTLQLGAQMGEVAVADLHLEPASDEHE